MANPGYNWPPKETILELAAKCKLMQELADALGVRPSTLSEYLRRNNLREEVQAALKGVEMEIVIPADTDPLAELIHQLLVKKKKQSFSVSDLADHFDVSPKTVRASLDTLRGQGVQLPEEEDEGGITLRPVQPAKKNLHKSLLDGDTITVGVISDTHLCSKEHAGPELDLAYDVFQDRGITEVWHAGDLVAGRGIYRTQDQDLTHFTYRDQYEHAIETYPKRDGITTRVIAGNHDIEGEFGKLGANPVIAVCNEREDLEYLGDYSAHIELPNGAFAQLVHGRGGGGYAVSYKPQKWVEGLPPGRKPAIVIFGHWHISGFFRHRNTSLLLGGCFEHQTSLLVRLGLQPDVGFWVLTLKLADDGSLISIIPEWTSFYEGRTVGGG